MVNFPNEIIDYGSQWAGNGKKCRNYINNNILRALMEISTNGSKSISSTIVLCGMGI